MFIRKKLIRRLVEELLEQNGIHAAPVPIDDIATSAGADIRYEPAEDSLSGFLLRGPAVPGEWQAIIGVNRDHSENRQRFSIAHELGHLLLHAANDPVHVDHRIRLRDEEAAKGTNLDEREANAFAAEILMPETFLRQDLESIQILEDEDISRLAQRYGVSQQALTFRLAKLGYQLE